MTALERLRGRDGLMALECPCGAPARPVPLMSSATQAVNRSCSSCHRLWRVVVRPLRSMDYGVAMHVAEWTGMGVRS